MKATYIGIASFMVVALLVTGGLGGAVSAASGPDSGSRIRLETGHTSDWDGGGYVAVNMTDGTNLAWFGVVYGTEEHPAPITIASMTLRYLGGAQVVDDNGRTLLNQIPIPVVTAFGQSLIGVFEFDDVGYNVPILGTYGAGNGLYDFSGPNLWSGAGSFEPVYKYVDMKRAWTLTEIQTTTDEVNHSVSFDFSLYATNVTYAKVWDPALNQYRNGILADGVVERLEFRFHIVASEQMVTTSVPFYQVTLNGGHVTGSKEIAPRNFTASHVDCGIKYDHIIQGWDAYPNATAPRLMLENAVVFAVGIPDIVQEWYNAQYVKTHVQDGAGLIEYQTDEGTQTVRDQSDLPERSTKVLTNTEIHSMDNWERVGTLSWVSNVTVDGQEKEMYYQIHVGAAGVIPTPKHDMDVKAIIILGGYVYPMGTDVVHDPSFASDVFQLNITDGLQALVFVLAIGAMVIVGCMIVALVVIRKHNRRGNDKFTYRQPPEYKQR
ncbi:MAG: hypothetical protein LUO79_01875 [Methanomassiliicoccales archaeon]|nr:hypothetical protein [Methanomassiliicoccales archaeon]